MTETSVENYIIHGLNYSKEEILTDANLQKEYLRILKHNIYKEKTRNYMRQLRSDEAYKEKESIKLKKRYAEDADYRFRILEKQRLRKLKKKELLEVKPVETRGRKPIYKLNEDLECIRIC